MEGSRGVLGFRWGPIAYTIGKGFGERQQKWKIIHDRSVKE
jgi:hypothetical protein